MDKYTNHMTKDRCEDCPVKVSISGAGVLHVDSKSLFKCCRTQKQIEAAARLRKSREVAMSKTYNSIYGAAGGGMTDV